MYFIDGAVKSLLHKGVAQIQHMYVPLEIALIVACKSIVGPLPRFIH